MKTVTVHEAKTNLSKLIERAERGEEIVIARRKTPVAKLVGLHVAIQARKFGSMRGRDHRDPFDRMLIAQAQLERVAIASGDEVFEAFGVPLFW